MSFVYVAYAAGVLLYDVVELVLYVRRAHVTLVGVLRSPDYATHHGFYRCGWGSRAGWRRVAGQGGAGRPW